MLEYQIKAYNFIKHLTNHRGQGLVEYGLLLVLIAVVLVAIVTLLGQNINNSYSTSTNRLP